MHCSYLDFIRANGKALALMSCISSNFKYDLLNAFSFPAMSNLNNKSEEETVRVVLDLPVSRLRLIESLKCQLGLSSRGQVIIALLEEILPTE